MATFWLRLGNFWATFIPTSGHTVGQFHEQFEDRYLYQKIHGDRSCVTAFAFLLSSWLHYVSKHSNNNVKSVS